MKECFVSKKFRAKSMELIEIANTIIAEYSAAGYTMTLRQLYYQMVAANHIANKQQSYDNLGNLISDARLAGLVDWDAIEDRTRNLRRTEVWKYAANSIRWYKDHFQYDRWQNQEYYFEVWVEKEALAGVVQDICDKLQVPWFACRGYVSQSEMYNAGKRISNIRETLGKRVIILHLGDHDPSGMDMTRDNIERLELFGDMTEGYDFEFKRIALNIDQVREYRLPENPAKLSDSRAGKYVAEYGRSSWELDALSPRQLEALIRSNVDDHRDWRLWHEWDEKENDVRSKFGKFMKYLNRRDL